MTLWDTAPHNGTPTSKAAAREVAPTLSIRQQIVLNAIDKFGAMTQDAIAARLAWPIQSVNPRVNELAAKGLIVQAGKGRSASGKAAVVWKIANR